MGLYSEMSVSDEWVALGFTREWGDICERMGYPVGIAANSETAGTAVSVPIYEGPPLPDLDKESSYATKETTI